MSNYGTQKGKYPGFYFKDWHEPQFVKRNQEPNSEAVNVVHSKLPGESKVILFSEKKF